MKLFTVYEISQKINKTEKQIIKIIHSNHIPFQRDIGRRFLIDIDGFQAIKKYCDENTINHHINEKKVTEEIRKIIEKKPDAKTCYELARQLKVDPNTIYRYRDNYVAYGRIKVRQAKVRTKNRG